MVTGQNRKQEGVDLQQKGNREEGGQLSHDQEPRLGWPAQWSWIGWIDCIDRRIKCLFQNEKNILPKALRKSLLYTNQTENDSVLSSFFIHRPVSHQGRSICLGVRLGLDWELVVYIYISPPSYKNVWRNTGLVWSIFLNMVVPCNQDLDCLVLVEVRQVVVLLKRYSQIHLDRGQTWYSGTHG